MSLGPFGAPAMSEVVRRKHKDVPVETEKWPGSLCCATFKVPCVNYMDPKQSENSVQMASDWMCSLPESSLPYILTTWCVLRVWSGWISFGWKRTAQGRCQCLADWGWLSPLRNRKNIHTHGISASTQPLTATAQVQPWSSLKINGWWVLRV